MGFWSALQIIFDILAGFAIFILLLKLARAPKDDPRLSRGLQILQSKIAILEDLSDRTENQVRGLMALLDQKNIEVQARIDKASDQVRIVEDSIRSSMDVAKIFQDKIPHQEIIERKNTLKYLQAAKLANQGQTALEIAQVVELPMGEIEFIAKVNRDQLTFSMEDLPAWAKAELNNLDSSNSSSSPSAMTASTNTVTSEQSSAQAPNPYESARHSYGNELNYLGNSNQERAFAFSPEIAPLASFANEPQFQTYQNSYPLETAYAAPAENQRFENRPLENQPEPYVSRELSAADNRQILTLKRTQSIIANLDRQFLMSRIDVQEEEETLPPIPIPIAIPVSAPPMPSLAPAIFQTPLAMQASAWLPSNSGEPNRLTNSASALKFRPQALKSYDPASIRKVIFPTISSQKVSNRSVGR